jgi:hypothetical protein
MTVHDHVFDTPSVPRLVASDPANPIVVPPSAAIDLDESFSALITRLTITRHLDGVAMRRNLTGRAFGASPQVHAARPGVLRGRTQPSERVG